MQKVTRNSNNLSKADGFFNIVITDKKGNKYNLRGSPLNKDRNKFEAMLIENPNIVENFTMDHITLSVHVIEPETTPEFDFL